MEKKKGNKKNKYHDKQQDLHAQEQSIHQKLPKSFVGIVFLSKN